MEIKHFYTLLLAAILSTAAVKADNGSFSPLASGHWVKISTKNSGIYQISSEELRSWGFDSADKVSIYGCGSVAGSNHNQVPDDGLCRAASTVTADGRILFYAEGPVRAAINPNNTSSISYTRSNYDDNSFYFITDSDTPVQVPVHAFSATQEISDWHYAIELIENEVQNFGKGSVFFHDRMLSAGEHVEFTYPVRNFYNADDAPACIFKIEAAAKTPSSLSMEIETPEGIEVTSISRKLNIPSSSAPNRLYMPSSSGLVNFRPGTFDGSELTFSFDVPASFSGSYLAVDKSWLKYPQKLIFDNNSDFFINIDNGSKPRNIKVAGLGSDDIIWDVTEPTDIMQLELAAADGGMLATPIQGTPRRLVAFSTSAAHRTVEYIGEVANQSLHTLSTPELLIVCSDACRECAEELAEIHRELQGLDVAVVSQEAIFNEFSSGAHHPGAVRRFAKMLSDRTPGTLRYLLLYGAADYSRKSQRKDDFLVCFETESYDHARDATTNYCSDQYFGMLGDDFNISTIHTKGKMDIAVGRIPVLDISLGRAVNKKIRRQLSSPIPARKYLQSLFLSDTGNDHSHIIQSSKSADILCKINPAATAIRADSELFPLNNSSNTGKECKALVERALQSGVGYFVYSGHGNANALSTNLFDMSSAASKEYGAYPFAMLATCGTFPLDRSTNSITDRMVCNSDGGMIAAISSCRSVYLDLNGVLNHSAMEAYAKASPHTCTGDILKEARNIMLQNNNGVLPLELGINLLCYNLCGDPAVPLGAPDFGIGVTSIGGKNTAQSELRLTAYANASLQAAITGKDGKVLDTFNGTAIIDIYDTPKTLKNLVGGSDDVIADDAIAATFFAPVKNGIIEATFAVPVPRSEEGTHRIVLTAIDNNTDKQAAGVLQGIVIDKPDDNYSPDIDSSAPVIEEFYINDSDFRSDGVTGSVFDIYATVHCGNGIVIDSNGIANVSQLRIDGKLLKNAAAALQPDYDGNYKLQYTAGPLSEGNHSLTLKVVGNNGESTSASLDFVVGSIIEGVLSADVTDPVREQVNLSVEANNSDIVHTRITVESIDGTVVYTHEGSSSFTWNLTDKNGDTVADGLYRVRALFTTAEGRGHTAPVELIVVK